MGRLAMMRGEFETAAQLYQQAVDLAPGWATAHNDQALVLSFMGQHAQAIQIVEVSSSGPSTTVSIKPEAAGRG